jgi:hypothetical protein
MQTQPEHTTVLQQKEIDLQHEIGGCGFQRLRSSLTKKTKRRKKQRKQKKKGAK